jgi:glycosyltransferase involved in cell wall biosynthesis
MNKSEDTVLILTPVKNAARYCAGYIEGITRLSYDPRRVSVGVLESDSTDGTATVFKEALDSLSGHFRSCRFFKHDFGFRVPDGMARYDSSIQVARRCILARARNQLLFRALEDHDWVLWLDVDVVEYPEDLIETLLGCGRDILHPNCVHEWGGESFDRNAWVDQGTTFMHDLRGKGRPVRLDSVGGTVLLIKADIHRDGLIFPPFRYGLPEPRIRTSHPVWGKGEIETEGLAAMARDMGHQCWGLPDLEVRHAIN